MVSLEGQDATEGCAPPQLALSNIGLSSSSTRSRSSMLSEFQREFCSASSVDEQGVCRELTPRLLNDGSDESKAVRGGDGILDLGSEPTAGTPVEDLALGDEMVLDKGKRPMSGIGSSCQLGSKLRRTESADDLLLQIPHRGTSSGREEDERYDISWLTIGTSGS